MLTRTVLVSLGISDTEASAHTIVWYSTYAEIPIGDDEDDAKAVARWLAEHADEIKEMKD